MTQEVAPQLKANVSLTVLILTHPCKAPLTDATVITVTKKRLTIPKVTMTLV